MGPHVIRTTNIARTWTQQSPIVKGCGNVGILQSAPANAIRVFRWVFNQQNLDDAVGTSNIILDMLAGYRHPQLFVEVWNEAHPTLAQLRAVTDLLHAQGLKVAGGSFGTGDYEQADFDIVQAAGCDAIAVHCYWDAGVLDQWEAYRYRTYWKEGYPDVLVTECGRRHGQHDVAELVQYAQETAKDSYVLGVTPFTAGPTPDWQVFDTDSITPQLMAALGGQPVPTPTPSGATLLFGPDVSSNNGRVPIAAVAKVADFVWIKATEGLTYVNPFFADQWQAAADLGLPRGAYHFARPSQYDPSGRGGRDEADFFLNTVKDIRSGDFFALDSEDRGVPVGADLVAHHLDFYQTADPAWGAPGIFYSGHWYTVDHGLETSDELATHGLWLEDMANPTAPVLIRKWPFWAWHQYGQGYLPGVVGVTDFNVFNGTLAQLRKYGKS